jgi:DNA-binding XRE family transcriptional regulator
MAMKRSDGWARNESEAMCSAQPTPSETRLAAVAYVDELAALVVKFVGGRVYAVALTDLEGVDSSPVERVSLGSDGYAALLEQRSGNRIEIPWDVVLYHAEPEYAFYHADPDARSTGAVIGEHIRAERVKRSLTLDKMSKLTGLKVPNLSRLENGRHLPSLETLEKVGMPVAALVVAGRAKAVERGLGLEVPIPQDPAELVKQLERG